MADNAGDAGAAYYDIVVVGGGVVGVAILRALTLANPSARTCLVEREAELLTGASGGNSSVMHCGFDGKPFTLEQVCVAWRVFFFFFLCGGGEAHTLLDLHQGTQAEQSPSRSWFVSLTRLHVGLWSSLWCVKAGYCLSALPGSTDRTCRGSGPVPCSAPGPPTRQIVCP